MSLSRTGVKEGETPALALALTLLAAPGQGDSLQNRHQEALATNPPEVSVELRMRDGRTRFHQGELIPLELAFSSTTPQRYELNAATYDRSGRLSLEDFHLEPSGGAVDPLSDYFASLGVHIGGGLCTMPLLDEEPVVIELLLNEWLRFDRPGDYRLFVTSRRIEDLTAEEGDREARWLAVTTNVVELFILPAQPGWSAQALEQARKDLDGAEEDRRRTGCAVLRHLGSPEAIAELVLESVEGADDCRFDAGLGLFAHLEREAVVGAMEAHLSAPSGVVDASFIDRLARLAWLGDHPLPAKDAELTSEHYAAMRRGIERRTATYAARLSGALDDKRGSARFASVTALLMVAGRLQDMSDLDLDNLRPLLAQHFGELLPAKQARLLEHSWRLLRDPSFRPVLLRLYEDPPELPWHGGTDLRDLAVRRLHDLDPGAAREILLAEMRRPQPRLDTAVFELFPDATLPPAVAAAVVENLRQLTSPRDGLDQLSSIIGRFGSVAIQGAIEQIVDSERYRSFKSCWRPPFLAYFLRVDPESGADRLRASLTRPEAGTSDRGRANRANARCLGKRLGAVAAFGFSPALERVAIETLDSGESKLEVAAVEILGRHGSAAAEAPLWRRLERWHQEWQGRPDELRYDRVAGRRRNEEAAQIEAALVAALSNGAGWVANPSELERFGRLWVSDQTRREIEALIAQVGDQAKLIVWDLTPPRFGVAQYDARSVAALKTRLAQYPEGTVFRWHSVDRKADPAAIDALFVELESWLAETGRGLVR